MPQTQKKLRLVQELPEGFQGPLRPVARTLEEAAEVDPAAAEYLRQRQQEAFAYAAKDNVRKAEQAPHEKYVETMRIMAERSAHEAAGGQFKEPEPGKTYSTLAEWVKATAMIPPVRGQAPVRTAKVVPIRGGAVPSADRS